MTLKLMCNYMSRRTFDSFIHENRGNVVNVTDLFSVGWLWAQGYNSPFKNIYFSRK